MRDAPDAVKALLASRVPLDKADCISITTTDGATDRWTTFDRDIVSGGNTWRAGGALVSRGKLGIRNTPEIPELELVFRCGLNYLWREVPFRQQILAGLMDGAVIDLNRAFMPRGSKGDASRGLVLMFRGKTGPVRQSGLLTTVTVRGGNVSMKQPAPKNCFQKPCLHTFCDTNCGKIEADVTITNHVGAGTTAGNVAWATVPSTTGSYTLGKITMTSGPSNGETRMVRVGSDDGLLLSYPFDNGVNVGDAFKVMQGCVKTRDRCIELNNRDHFRGFPNIPQATLAA